MSTLLKQAHDNLSVHLVRMRSGEFELRHGIAPEQAGEIDMNSQVYSGVQSITGAVGQRDDSEASSIKIYTFSFAVGVRLIDAKETEDDDDDLYEDVAPTNPAIVEVQAVFDAEYFSQAELDESILKEFAHKNVAYHVWPYWREFVQSAASRMCLPHGVLTVPFYLVPDNRRSVDKTRTDQLHPEN